MSTFQVDPNTGEVKLKDITVIADPAVTKIEDMSVMSSVDNKWLFVATINFLSPNKIFSFSVNNNTGSLSLVDTKTVGYWNSGVLPLRVSSLEVSPNGLYLFAGFTSPGGYLAVYLINVDGTLTQEGPLLQPALAGQSASFVAVNNKNDKVYAALGNEPILSVAALSFDGTNFAGLPGSPVSLNGVGSAIAVSLSNDNNFLFATSYLDVVMFPLDSNGVPIASKASIINE